MADPPASSTPRRRAPRAAEKLSVLTKVGWGTGGAAQYLMGNSFTSLALPIYNLGLGVSAGLIGTALAIPRLWDAITDPIIGNISDNTRSRWGRRRPYIIAGAFLSAITFALCWWPDPGWSTYGLFAFFLTMTMLFYTAFTVWQVPWGALGYEITYDYNERTSVQAYRNFIGSIANFVLPWLYAMCRWDWAALTGAAHSGWWERIKQLVHGVEAGADENPEVAGARIVGIIVGVLILLFAIVPALTARERTGPQRQPRIALLPSLKLTLSNRPFLILSGIVMLMMIGLFMVNPLGLYINIYHVYGGDKTAAAKIIGIGGTVWAACSLASVPVTAWLAGRVGKKRALIIGLVCVIIGEALHWPFYTPDAPMLQLISLAIICPGVMSLWIITASMLADVCDEDELISGMRREGMYGAVFGWVFKLGFAGTTAVSGWLIEVAGINPDLPMQSPRTILTLRLLFTFVPVFFVSLALLLTLMYPLTEQRAREVRAELDTRHADDDNDAADDAE